MKKWLLIFMVLVLCLAAAWYIMRYVPRQGWELTPASGPIHLTQGKSEDVVFSLTRKGQSLAGKSVHFAAHPNFSGLPLEPVYSDDTGFISFKDVTVLSPKSQILEAVLENGAKVAIPVAVTSVSYTIEASPKILTQYKTEDVVLELKANGVHVPAGTGIVFEESPVFRNLPAEMRTRDAGGVIPLTGLTAEVTGSREIPVSINGSSASFEMEVVPATYSLAMEKAHPLSLEPERAVQFALLQNGQPLPDGTRVALTYEGTGAFVAPPDAATVGSDGFFSLDLTGKIPGEVIITATVEKYCSAAASLPVEVKAADYAVRIETSQTPGSYAGMPLEKLFENPQNAPKELAESDLISAEGIFKAQVTNHGVPAAGQRVNFSWKVKGGSQKWQPAVTQVTDENGEAIYTAQAPDYKTIMVTASLERDAARTAVAEIQFGPKLPSGFFAQANTPMNWEDAKAYCELQGGKLPKINRAAPCDGTVISIEGFGVRDWPFKNLSGNCYWSLDTPCYNSDSAWSVCNIQGKVNVGQAPRSDKRFAACVPQ